MKYIFFYNYYKLHILHFVPEMVIVGIYELPLGN